MNARLSKAPLVMGGAVSVRAVRAVPRASVALAPVVDERTSCPRHLGLLSYLGTAICVLWNALDTQGKTRLRCASKALNRLARRPDYALHWVGAPHESWKVGNTQVQSLYWDRSRDPVDRTTPLWFDVLPRLVPLASLRSLHLRLQLHALGVRGPQYDVSALAVLVRLRDLQVIGPRGSTIHGVQQFSGLTHLVSLTVRPLRISTLCVPATLRTLSLDTATPRLTQGCSVALCVATLTTLDLSGCRVEWPLFALFLGSKNLGSLSIRALVNNSRVPVPDTWPQGSLTALRIANTHKLARSAVFGQSSLRHLEVSAHVCDAQYDLDASASAALETLVVTAAPERQIKARGFLAWLGAGETRHSLRALDLTGLRYLESTDGLATFIRLRRLQVFSVGNLCSLPKVVELSVCQTSQRLGLVPALPSVSLTCLVNLCILWLPAVSVSGSWHFLAELPELACLVLAQTGQPWGVEALFLLDVALGCRCADSSCLKYMEPQAHLPTLRLLRVPEWTYLEGGRWLSEARRRKIAVSTVQEPWSVRMAIYE